MKGILKKPYSNRPSWLPPRYHGSHASSFIAQYKPKAAVACHHVMKYFSAALISFSLVSSGLWLGGTCEIFLMNGSNAFDVHYLEKKIINALKTVIQKS